MAERTYIKENVIAAFGSVSAAAEFFGIERQAIYQWPDGKPIPEKRQYEIQLRRPDLLEEAAA